MVINNWRPRHAHDAVCLWHMQNLIGVRVSLLVFLFISLFLSFSFALAQDGTSGTDGASGTDGSVLPPPGPGKPKVRPIDKMRMEWGEVKEKRQGVKEELHDLRVGTKEKVIDLRGETKMLMKNASSGPERKDIMKGHIEERKGIFDARKASSTDLHRKLRDLAHKHLRLAGERFRRALEHLHKIEERVGNRIEKLEGQGVDVSAAETALATASTAIVKAEADAKAVKDFVDGIADGSDPKTTREQVAALVKTANASLKAAHEALRKAVEALKALPKPARAPADAEPTE